MATHSILLPGESHGQRSLGAGSSPWGPEQSDTTERLLLSLFPLPPFYPGPFLQEKTVLDNMPPGGWTDPTFFAAPEAQCCDFRKEVGEAGWSQTRTASVDRGLIGVCRLSRGLTDLSSPQHCELNMIITTFKMGN